MSEIDPSLFSEDSITEPSELEANLEKSLRSLSKIQESLENNSRKLRGAETARKDTEPAKFASDIDKVLKEIPESFSILNSIVVEFSLLQAQARSNSIELEEVDLTDTQAFAIAKCFRRDWMNARAALVDQYRRIEFVADQLESQVDLVLEGDVGNFGDNPFKIRWENGSLRAGLRFDAPIVRLAERNSYRQTLIQYQQTKRAFYEFRDDVHLNLRQTLRSLNLNKAIFEINRKSVQARIKEVDNVQLQLVQPVGPGQSSRLGATAARDLTSAIDGLQGIQIAFLNSWVAYEVARRNLDFDLGTMQIDDQGRWIDPGKIDSSIAQRAAAMLGVDMDVECQFCDQGMIFSEPAVDPIDDLNYESAPRERNRRSEDSRNRNSTDRNSSRNEDFKLDLPDRPVPADLKPEPRNVPRPQPTPAKEPTPAVPTPAPDQGSGVSNNKLIRNSVNESATSERPSNSRSVRSTPPATTPRPTPSVPQNRPRVLNSAQSTPAKLPEQAIPKTPSTEQLEEIPRLEPEPELIQEQLSGNDDAQQNGVDQIHPNSSSKSQFREQSQPREQSQSRDRGMDAEGSTEETYQPRSDLSASPTAPVRSQPQAAPSRTTRPKTLPKYKKQRDDKSIPIPQEVLELGKQDDARKKVSAVDTPNFFNTDAGLFQKVDISELDDTEPLPGGILKPVYKSMTFLETEGKIQISALPGSEPVIETPQVGVHPEVADAVISTEEADQLRPISTTVKQLRWSGRQTSHLQDTSTSNRARRRTQPTNRLPIRTEGRRGEAPKTLQPAQLQPLKKQPFKAGIPSSARPPAGNPLPPTNPLR